MGELESNLADVVAGQHGRCLFVFIPLRARALPCARGDRMQSNRRNTVTLLLGGARSGKSHYAQQLGERAGTSRLCCHGAAWRRRDAAQSRPAPRAAVRSIGKPWRNLWRLAEAIARHGPGCDLMIIDCLTFFAANLLDAGVDDQTFDRWPLPGAPVASLLRRAGVE